MQKRETSMEFLRNWQLRLLMFLFVLNTLNKPSVTNADESTPSQNNGQVASTVSASTRINFDESSTTDVLARENFSASSISCEEEDAVYCNDGITCIPLNWLCDGSEDCPDGSDEQFSGPGFKCVTKTSDVRCTLPQLNLFDGKRRCSDNADHCFDKNDNLTSSCFLCLDSDHVISTFQVCDGILDCADFSDECLCENVQTPEVCGLYNKTGSAPSCLENDYDYIDADYETGLTRKPADWTPDIIISCGNGHCVRSHQLCDRRYDCDNELDEKYCYTTSTEEYLIELQNFYAIMNKTYSLASFVNLSSVSNETVTCESTLYGIITATLCDGRVQCKNLMDECSSKCGSDLPPFCEADLSCLSFESAICNGLWETDLDCEERIDAEELDCFHRFYCQNGLSISISDAQVCDGIVNCDDESDESADQNCEDGRFYCETRSNISSPTNRLFVPGNLKFNGRFDCEDGSDECPSSFEINNLFSSRQELIKSTVLRVILWIIGPVSLLGNVFVLIKTSISKYRNRNSANSISRTHTFMMINLSVADGLMGVYLIMLSVMSTIFSGEYCYQDKPWRTGSLCRVMGTLVIIASESSVTILLIMGIFRFYTVLKPFDANFSAKAHRYVYLATALAWILSITLAILPWFLETFDSHVWFPSPFFLSDVVKKEAYASFFERMTEQLRRTNRTTDAYQLVSVANNTFISKPLLVKGRLNFYSQNGVCLPNFFTRPGEAGWHLTLFLITFNFVAFLTMVTVYALIWKMTTAKRTFELRKNVGNGTKLNYQKCKLQNRVTRLLLTDFLCWIPLCIMAYLYFGGVPIDKVVHAVSGIVLLPINSALNPILYSGVGESCCQALRACYHKNFSSLKSKFGLESSVESADSISEHPGKFVTSKALAEDVTVTISASSTPRLQHKGPIISTEQ